MSNIQGLINVADVLRDIPHFETFCSVQKLHGLLERLSADPRFVIDVAGKSVKGLPIHHVRFGQGATKALILGGPHAMEPMSSMTVFSLLTLLSQGHPALVAADVEWHVVPCIDPDGALLNEGWSQKPFTVENYIRNFYVQPRVEQVDFSFPITYDKWVFDQPSKEARVLQAILDQVRPDFLFSLHNSGILGGSCFLISRDIGQDHYALLYELLRQDRFSLWRKTYIPQYAEGMWHLPSAKLSYDNYKKNGIPIPEGFLQGKIGSDSTEYLSRVRPDALAFIAEVTYGVHPSDDSDQETGEHLRQFRLKLHADQLFLAATILEEWQKTQEDLDTTSPLHRKIVKELVDIKDRLHGGVVSWYQASAQLLLFDPENSRMASERDRAVTYMFAIMFLANAYTFVRLLKESKQTPAVCQATQRMERLFDERIESIKQALDFSAYELKSCDQLVRTQFGSGLIALNSVLQSRADRKN